jgi:hypothetical protein
MSSDKLVPPHALTRRAFAGLVLLGASALSVGCFEDETQPMDQPATAAPPPPDVPRFLTDDERLVLGALADYVLPPDEYKGGKDLAAVRFIEALLTALETDPPRLFVAGPLSDRNPIPGPDGRPLASRPQNGFLNLLPLTREQELDWRLQLYGSAGVPGGGPNEALLGPIVGLRQLFRDGLARVRELTRLPPEAITIGDIDDVWTKIPAGFRAVVADLVVQSALAIPEYGGNLNQEGWRMIHSLGDTAPLGFTPFDERAGQYTERPGEPFSQRDPRPDPDPIDAEIRLQIEVAVAAIGGRKFY